MLRDDLWLEMGKQLYLPSRDVFISGYEMAACNSEESIVALFKKHIPKDWEVSSMTKDCRRDGLVMTIRQMSPEHLAAVKELAALKETIESERAKFARGQEDLQLEIRVLNRLLGAKLGAEDA